MQKLVKYTNVEGVQFSEGQLERVVIPGLSGHLSIETAQKRARKVCTNFTAEAVTHYSVLHKMEISKFLELAEKEIIND